MNRLRAENLRGSFISLRSSPGQCFDSAVLFGGHRPIVDRGCAVLQFLTETVLPIELGRQEKSQELDEGVPRAPDMRSQRETDRKRFPRRFCRNPQSDLLHPEFHFHDSMYFDARQG